MKKTSLSTLLILALGLAMFSACGGGSSSTPMPLPSPPTVAVLKLSTEVTGSIPAGTTINSYSVTITLPDGVTVKASPDSTNPAILVTNPGVVTAAGTASGASVLGVYTEASGTAPGTVKIYLVKVDPVTGAGFDPGVFCTVTCDFTAGHSPKASDFAPLTLDDATGMDATLSTVTLTGELSLTATASLR